MKHVVPVASLLLVLTLGPVLALAGTIAVPSDFPTIQSAVNNASVGDVIVLAPGTYTEDRIFINKKLTITSQWRATGNATFINQTIINGSGKTIFETVNKQGVGVEISGLKFINARKPIIAHDLIAVKHNIFSGNDSDCISFEAAGYGYVGHNIIEDCGDDGIDIDALKGSFVIEHNMIVNNKDDGIEIRLFDNSAAGMQYDIHDNILRGNQEDGIQLINYFQDTGRKFSIYRNVLADNTDVGLGCMPDGNTGENFGGSDMKEEVLFYNNTVTRNRLGVTGADNFIAINNIIANNATEGVKRFRHNSIVDRSLFFNNGTHIDDAITGNGNLFNVNPQFDPNTYDLLAGSPSIDGGLAQYIWQGELVIDWAPSTYNGGAPDLGAKEFDGSGNSQNLAPIVDAGSAQVLLAPQQSANLAGVVTDDGLPNGLVSSQWTKTNGPDPVDFGDATNPSTSVTFSSQGIYQLRLTGDDGELSSSDSVTIRMAQAGAGDVVSLNSPGTTYFEAEEFSYLYGEARSIPDPEASGQVAIETPEDVSGPFSGLSAFTEHTLIVTNQGVTFYVWVRGKGVNDDGNTVSIKFKNSADTLVHLPNTNAYGWTKMAGSFTVSAGSWPLIIRAREAGVIWDQVIFTTDANFVPTPNTPSSNIQISINSKNDDAEEFASGQMYLGSSDLELVNNGSSRGDQTIGLRFNNVPLLPGTVVQEAYVQFTVDETGSFSNVSGTKSIYGERSDNATTFTSETHNISSRPRTSAVVHWDPPWWNTVGLAGPDQQTPDLKAIVQEVIDRPGWNTGNSLALIIEGSGKRVAESHEGTAPPVLVIKAGGGGSTGGGTTTTIESQITHGYDDAEEKPDGSVSRGSSDLELVNDGSDQLVGLNFGAVSVPQGATIVNAYVQFTAKDGNSSVPGIKTIRGEASDSAPAFRGTKGDLSGRTQTAASVSWNPPNWNIANEISPAQRTPNLSTIVQEIIDRAGWSSGNRMVFLIEGSGRHRAWSVDGKTAASATLHIEYQ